MIDHMEHLAKNCFVLHFRGKLISILSNLLKRILCFFYDAINRIKIMYRSNFAIS
jgi:hypothetical protein